MTTRPERGVTTGRTNSWRVGLLLAALVSAAPHAQSRFENIPSATYNLDRQRVPDPTLQCAMLPEAGPDPRALGLPAALAAAERRELSLGGLSLALRWADHEADPALVPALKRLVEEYRCWENFAQMVLVAIEATGEPASYFLDLAAGWERDDRLAAAAMSTLGTRGDSSAYEPLRAAALLAVNPGPRGHNPHNAFGGYFGAMRWWAMIRHAMTPRQQLDLAGSVAFEAIGVPLVQTPAGLAVSDEITYAGSHWFAIPRRLLRELAATYPAAVEATLAAYADSSAARLRARGVRETAVPLYLARADEATRAAAFPSGVAQRLPAVTAAALVPAVCVEAARDVWTGEARPGLIAVFSYASGEPTPVRVAYGAANRLDGVTDGSPPPEVFVPPGADVPGNPFRVALPAGGAVSWTLLGQTATATPETARCPD